LDGEGPLLLVELQLVDGVLGAVDEAAGGDELGVEEVRAVPLAEDAERRVGHVLHRGEEERAGSEVEVGEAHGAESTGQTPSGSVRIPTDGEQGTVDRRQGTEELLRGTPSDLRPSPFALRPSPFALRPSPFALRPSTMTQLSVNLNKVALVRNARSGTAPGPHARPSVRAAAEACVRAGAHGLTLHPRPDGRHALAADVLEFAAWLGSPGGAVELNVEGNPFAGPEEAGGYRSEE